MKVTSTKEKKWQVILPYECDAVFVVSYNGKVFEDDNFYVGKDYLIEYIKKLLQCPQTRNRYKKQKVVKILVLKN
ncbi:MAG: hypothetical protein QW472_01770 [Candidatus Aenigmatarchaeota archaeon]